MARLQNILKSIVSLQAMMMAIADGWIVRLPCLDEGSFEFSRKEVGFALRNSTIATFNNMDFDECKAVCYDEFKCKSINYSERLKICEINSKLNETSHFGDFIETTGFTYMATNYETKNMGKVCQELNPCSLDATYCRDTCISQGYRCITCPKYHEVRYEQYCQLKEFVNRFYELRNIARGKAVASSSIVPGWFGSYVVDGEISCYRMFYSVSTHPWWMVDLGHRAVVLNVAVLTVYEDMLNPFDIHIGDNTNTVLNPICIKDASVANAEMKNFTCSELEGRLVSINLHPTISDTTRQIVICEVEVYGIYLQS